MVDPTKREDVVTWGRYLVELLVSPELEEFGRRVELVPG